MEKKKRRVNLKAIAACILAVLFIAAVIGTVIANYYAVSLRPPMKTRMIWQPTRKKRPVRWRPRALFC